MHNPLRAIEFYRSVFAIDQMPQHTMCEVVVCGRSNVGKSSLINHLTEKKVAKASQTPGKTKSINFYALDTVLYLVDLPGYGYAQASKKEKSQFKMLLDAYFKMDRCNLILFLVDSRHNPSKQDVQMFDYLTYFGIPFVLICTKVDKLKGQEKKQIEKKMKPFFGLKTKPVLYSIEEQMGKNDLLVRLKEFGIFE
jgi:GTP-binding protein